MLPPPPADRDSRVHPPPDALPPELEVFFSEYRAADATFFNPWGEAADPGLRDFVKWRTSVNP